MEKAVIDELVNLAPFFTKYNDLWTKYDADADVLYINFAKPAINAEDSELTDDDIIVRYAGNMPIGITLLHAKQRKHY
jgi:uncharacterized protein YuzE